MLDVQSKVGFTMKQFPFFLKKAPKLQAFQNSSNFSVVHHHSHHHREHIAQ